MSEGWQGVLGLLGALFCETPLQAQLEFWTP